MIWLALFLASIGSGWIFGAGCREANFRMARDSSAEVGFTLLLGLTLGLLNRDRIRLRRVYASPSLAYLAKVLAFLSLDVVLTFLFSPVGWPPQWLHAGIAGISAGLCFWMGSLPPRM